ncbi:ATP-dependent RecD-like DNA helicase [Sulfurospirillum sp. 1307]
MEILEKVKEHLKTKNLLLTGGGGVGKSYLTTKLIESYKKEGKQVVVLGSTGVSAVNVGGYTIHSFFSFGISNNLEEMKKHDRYTKQRVKELNKILQKADLLIIDEISMVSSDLMDMILYRLRNGSFEGRLLFVGDFYQLPPIKSKKETNSLFDSTSFAFESPAWDYFDPYIIELTKTKRTEDEEFFAILNAIRKGDLNPEIITYLQKLRENLHVKENTPTILYGINARAEATNKKKLQELEGEHITLKAKEKLHLKSLHVNKIENWKKNLPVPVELDLKIGASVLFCTNKWGSYYNGERGIVLNIDDEEVIVQKSNDKVVKVKRAEYTLSESIVLNGEIEEKPLVSIEQFPLKLAYAITIHKSQGMSIDTLVCNIDNIFEKSQFYVAISRAKNPKNLLLEYNYNSFENHLKRCVLVSNSVRDFYENNKIDKIEEGTLF